MVLGALSDVAPILPSCRSSDLRDCSAWTQPLAVGATSHPAWGDLDSSDFAV